MSWTRFFRRRYWDEERARELDTYVAIETEENIARGMPPSEARDAARRKLGNTTRIREDVYDMNTVAVLETTWKDLCYGARLLRRNPAFAIVAVLTLAIGTGANTAIFQLVDAVRLRSLPVERPGELAEIRIGETPNGRTGSFAGRRPMLTNALWEGIRDGQQAFSSVAAWGNTAFDLATGGEMEPIEGLWVSGSFFETLGVHAALGRVLTASDDRPACESAAVVISDPFWKAKFGSDRGIVGRTITLDGHKFGVAGVTPPGFFGVEVGRSFDVAVPICAEAIIRGPDSVLKDKESWFLAGIGRLKPGWDLDRASAQLAAMSEGLVQSTVSTRYNPEDVKAYLAFRLKAFDASTGVSTLRRVYTKPLWILLGATGLVLLIACANLANLMLVRTTAREREIAVRLAIGASRRRIVRQMISESLLIAAAGTLGGLVLAQWLSGFLVQFLSTSTNQLFMNLAFDWRMFAFCTSLAVASCLLFGVGPAIRATRANPGTAIKSVTRGSSEGRERFRLRRLLVVAQVALSLVLLVGALLFLRSLRNLATVDAGFRQEGVLIATFDLRKAAVGKDARLAFNERIVDGIKGVPGATDAAQVAIVPVSGSGWNNRIVIGGVEQKQIVNFNQVGPGYFRTLGTPLLAGRDFTPQDTRQPGGRVAIVNELFARKLFPGGNAIGQAFQVTEAPGDPRPLHQIIGIVKDAKYTDLREDIPPTAYVASSQDADPGTYLQVVVHSAIPPATVAGGITQAMRQIDPAISVRYRTMTELVRNSLISERLMATLSGFFALVAGLIATLGLYGVMSYMIARRRVEIGIRMALGADRRRVVGLILREAGVLLLAGLIIGLGLAIAGGRAAATLLYGLQPWDAPTLASAMIGLALVASLATWVPARRASRLEPTAALRED